MKWSCVLKLDESRKIVDGSVEALASAVRRGADLRSYTTFNYAEHMGVPDSTEGLVEEMMSYTTVYCLNGSHVAGIQTTRYPADSAMGFLRVPSLSFFLNNENGMNGIARPFLDGQPRPAKPTEDYSGKYRVIDQWDNDSACPSENFTYDFGQYGWWVNDSWEEVLAHESDGSVTQGSLAELSDAFRRGKRLKVGIRNLCANLALEADHSTEHEVFVELHSIYHHRDSGFLGGESQPLVRVAPCVPLQYKSGNWNYGWILPRTDGMVHQVIIHPCTHQFSYSQDRYAVRWFVQ